MRKTWGKLGGGIVGPYLLVCLLFLMISPVFCRAQMCPVATITSITPDTWYTGVTNTSTLTGNNLHFGSEECQVTDNLTVGPIDGNGFGNTVPWTTFQEGIIPNQDFNTTQQFVIVIPDSVPTETATYTVYGYCDGNVEMDCFPGTFTIFWATSFPVHIVNKCTPTITSISPSTWFAGKTYDNVVIKGTGFTTAEKATADCPVTAVNITAADGSVVPVSGVNVDSKTKITLTVAPPADDTTETATVTLGTAPNTGNSDSLATPPQILGNEIHCDPSMKCTQDVISTTDGSQPPVQSVVVGQPIILTTNPNLPATITPYKTIWTVGGTNIAAYAVPPDASSATVTKTVLKNATLNTYWVYPEDDNIPVTYTYCVNIPGVGNQCSQEADASFNVTGPTATITPTPTSWSVTPQMSCPTIVQFLYFGYPNPTSGCSQIPLIKGISFQAALSSVPDSGGTTEWVQLISKDTLSGVSLSGVPALPASYGVGLDNSYPYPPDDPTETVTTIASDSPNNDLDPSLARETRRFKADMYYLWKPQISGSIFVPLGYVKWSASGTAVQHTKDSPPWSLATSGLTTAVFNASSDTGNAHGYPTWSRVVMNTNSNGNENGDEGEGLEEQQ